MCIRDRYQRRVRVGIEEPAIIIIISTSTHHPYLSTTPIQEDQRERERKKKIFKSVGMAAAAGQAMREAAKTGDLEAVKKHLETGADINFKDRQGNTALHMAALFGHREIVHFLLEKGANKTITNNYKETPEEVANGMVLAEEIRDWK
eukprot:TRINITY_DN1315_c0_g1_i2.p1 TRINITY_DN1315_c0_g1~~TRINITY_DN1315_c0_g1_i2.p1  ORF type:complete len:148 (+),score=44.55 TRINITY_DN1315_c0_g1_i2:2-445(+)